MAVRGPIYLAVSALWMIAAGSVAAAEDAVLEPHRAVYDLQLEQASARTGIAGVSGRMVLEVTGSECDGWTVSFRNVNDFSLSEGSNRLIDHRSSSWEAGDGSTFRHTQRQYVDGRLEEEMMVTVTRGGADEAGRGAITKPEEMSFTLPEGSLFPVAHQNKLLAGAAAGERRDESTVYDGSDGATSYRAISFIGPQRPPEAPERATGSGAEALAEQPSWPVTISYFPAGEVPQGEETPSHQVSFDMYANGVAGDLVLDYGDFALEGTLTEIEMLDQPSCD